VEGLGNLAVQVTVWEARLRCTGRCLMCLARPAVGVHALACPAKSCAARTSSSLNSNADLTTR